MPNIYTSKNVENGLTFDDLITKLLAYKPEQWGYTEQDFNNIKTDFNVSENSLYNLPLGNYKLKNMPNSPFNSEFVNVKTLMGNANNKIAICSIGGSIDYGTNLSETNPNGSGWKDLSTEKRQNIDAAIIVVSDTAPVGPFNNGIPLWVDTSKAYITGEIFLKILSGNDTWTSYTVTDSMDMSIYDKNGLKKDPYKEVMNEVEKFIGDYTEIIMHINNELKLIHIDASDREYFDTYLLTSENVAKYFEKGGEFYTEMVEYIKSTITTTTGLDTSAVSTNFNTLKESLKNHYDNHITEEDVENWNNKVAVDHTHNLDPNVTVDVSDIAFGDSTIPEAAVPESVKERPVLITSLSVLKNVDTSLLESTYHNGNMLYLANGNDGYDFYKIVDNSYFNTDDYMKGVKKFSVEIGEVNFVDAIKVPSNGYTLADYGITDALSTSDLAKLEKFYEDELKCEIVPSNLTAEAVGTSDLYVKVQSSVGTGVTSFPEAQILVSIDNNKDLSGDVYWFRYKQIAAEIEDQKIVSNTAQWGLLCYGKDKFVTVESGTTESYESNVFAYSSDGITWTQGTLPISAIWGNTRWAADTIGLCYGLDKFILIPYNTTTYLYSSDGITWTQGTIPANEDGYLLCYGANKFVLLSVYNNVCLYSSDGITWTQGSLPSSKEWQSICYGKDKFVVVAFESDVFAYSTDGITWTQGNLPKSRQWCSICYGNGMFVVVTNGWGSGGHTGYLYSSNGISWTSSNLPLYGGARYWHTYCDDEKMLVFESSRWDRDIAVIHYSYDGINWSSIMIPYEIFAICYTNGKFIASAASNKSGLTWISIKFINPINIIDIYQTRISEKSTSDYFKAHDKYQVDTSAIIELYNDRIEIDPFIRFHIKIYWDPERGLVFASPNMVSKLITADFINKNELTESALEAFNNRGRAIDEKLS